MFFDYSQSAFEIREDLPVAYREIWEMISMPGNWWSGAQRIAIAAESREALNCELCARRKSALSPFSVNGTHTCANTTGSVLPEFAIDAVHRLVTDASRLTESWLNQGASAGLDHHRYIELLGIVVAVISIDGFHRAMGLPLEPLPEPVDGAPDEYTPGGLEDMGAWIPMVSPARAQPNEVDLYGGRKQTGNVVAAMSLVPDSVRMLKTLSAVQYLEMQDVANPLADGGRHLSRPQIELLAGRVSSLNDCFY